MKKTFTTLSCIMAAMGITNAQQEFVVSPIELDGASLSIYAEGMSQNQTYVVGQDQDSQCPVIWNTQTGDVVILSEKELIVDEEGNTYSEDWTGYFHAVNGQGVAVGDFGAMSVGSHAIMCDVNNPGDYVILYEEEGDAGNVAYGISEDGKTVVGFHFDAAWVTHGCVWTDGGEVRTDLPWPTAEECGFDVDYASARGISGDGSVIMGYAQESNFGSWVLICWKRQADGSYAVNAEGAKKFFEYDYQLGKPYMTFEPTGLSYNGEWVALTVVEEYDPFDWSYTPMNLAARLNVKSNTLEVLPGVAANIFSVSDNGTAVGRMTDETFADHGIVWNAGTEELQQIEDICADELADAMSTSLSAIIGDGTAATGVMMCIEGDVLLQAAFVAQLPVSEAPVGIKDVQNAVRAEGAYDLMGRRVLNTKGHLIVAGGKLEMR